VTSPAVAETTVVALSGGVDSAVAASLLAERGYDLVAVMLRLRGGNQRSRPVPTSEAVDRARRTCDQLHIPFRLIDAREVFHKQVVEPFIAQYAAGRTPNPCVRCNRFLRFGLLLDRALTMGAQALATGHYARVRGHQGLHQLLRGEDPDRDQSYFLYQLTQDQLARVLFPLGELTKEAVRDYARRRGLPVSGQPSSQDICFLARQDYRRFLADRAPHVFRPGPIRDTGGRVLGQHQGLPAYTIGQRKGLGISAAEPLYVLAIRPEDNELIVGTAGQLDWDWCLVERMHVIDGQPAAHAFRALAQIRYRARPASVVVYPLTSRLARVVFDSPQRGIAPGQSLVLYDGDAVLGGGIICGAYDSML
jgi:tRNA-specific 2-thiouridylase